MISTFSWSVFVHFKQYSNLAVETSIFTFNFFHPYLTKKSKTSFHLPPLRCKTAPWNAWKKKKCANFSFLINTIFFIAFILNNVSSDLFFGLALQLYSPVYLLLPHCLVQQVASSRLKGSCRFKNLIRIGFLQFQKIKPWGLQIPPPKKKQSTSTLAVQS